MEVSKGKILFISYDGMSDPLGQSQVLPYLAGLSKAGYEITLLSCEKADRIAKGEKQLRAFCALHRIDWSYVLFHSKPPIAAKFYDIFNMKRKAIDLYKEKKFDMIHCRSYVSVSIGLWLKNKFGVKVLFDMRGFWVDERVDGGLWQTDKLFYRLAYAYYKKKEAYYIQHSDHIILLTEAGKRELIRWPAYTGVPVTVVSCSADFDVFSLTEQQQKFEARARLGIPKEDIVVSYLGSLGTWYMLEEMLLFFNQLKKVYPTAKFLFLTPENPSLVHDRLPDHGLEKKDFIILFSERKQIPGYIKASDFSLSFIKPAYSKIASSPTKIGELLAMGIPVISNRGIGDVEEMIEETGCGIVVADFSSGSFDQALKKLPALLSVSPEYIRSVGEKNYSLQHAIEKYKEVYKSLV